MSHPSATNCDDSRRRRQPALTRWFTAQEHLTALYFPCFLRTYLAASFTFEDQRSYMLYAFLLRACLNTAAVTRFVREHPDELWDAFVRIVSALAGVPEHIWQREVSPILCSIDAKYSQAIRHAAADHRVLCDWHSACRGQDRPQMLGHVSRNAEPSPTDLS